MVTIIPNAKPILPWSNDELERLLKDLVAHGTEAAKVDFKSELEAASPEQKADLLKDITAIGNTYATSYDDHGFVIFGVQGKFILGIKQDNFDGDKLQNHIEQLLKTYISPMPEIYVVSFLEPTGARWGAIIIPPRNNKPYMFVKELQCPDPKRTRRRGEWFVRRGATTDLGLPEDLAYIAQRQTELLLEPLRESMRSLQLRVAKVEEAYNGALFNLVAQTASKISGSAEVSQEASEKLGDVIGEALGMDLPTRFKQSLRRVKDPLAEDLIAEARSLSEFLASPASALPWAPHLNSPDDGHLIELLEEKTRPLQLAVATIILHDDKDVYTGALVRSFKVLAREVSVPSGTTFNRIGEALRYYPLGLLLYTAFVCGVVSNRGGLLKLLSGMQLKAADRSGMGDPISSTFFYWSGANGFFNECFGKRWCEPTAERIRQVLNDSIGESFVEVSEPEAFFQGEFVLSLVHIDAAITSGRDAGYWVPIPGLYLHSHEAHGPIADLLGNCPVWLEKVYTNPLIDLLRAFDQNARHVANPNCFWYGLPNTAQIYLEARERMAPTK